VRLPEESIAQVVERRSLEREPTIRSGGETSGPVDEQARAAKNPPRRRGRASEAARVRALRILRQIMCVRGSFGERFRARVQSEDQRVDVGGGRILGVDAHLSQPPE